MLETRKVDNNKTRKALFVYLRPLCNRYALVPEVSFYLSVVNKWAYLCGS